MNQCPECDFAIQFKSGPKKGDQLTCPNCGSRLVVLRLNPVELDWAFQAPLHPAERSEEPEQPV